MVKEGSSDYKKVRKRCSLTECQHITVQSKAKLARLVKTAMGIIGKREYQTLESSYEHSVLKEVTKILSDPSHSLYSEYELLPSGR